MGTTTNSLAYMGAEEFMNTFLMMWSFDESKEILKKYLPLPEGMNPYLKEATESAEQLIVMSGIFKLMQHSEKFLEFLFEMGRTVIIALLGLAKVGYNKLKSHAMKGRKFKFISGILGSVLDDAIEKCKIFVDWIRNLIVGRQASSETGTMMTASTQSTANLVAKDKSAMDMGANMATNTINSLMFKMMTKTFNASDEAVLKKILGRQTVGNLKIEDMNKVANFMYVPDSTGANVGLSEQMMSLLNGMGYVHKTSSTPAV